jgi:hypothetical protein
MDALRNNPLDLPLIEPWTHGTPNSRVVEADEKRFALYQ